MTKITSYKTLVIPNHEEHKKYEIVSIYVYQIQHLHYSFCCNLAKS